MALRHARAILDALRCQRANIRRIWRARTDVVDPDLPMYSYLRTHFALSTVRRRRWFWSHGYRISRPRLRVQGFSTAEQALSQMLSRWLADGVLVSTQP